MDGVPSFSVAASPSSLDISTSKSMGFSFARSWHRRLGKCHPCHCRLCRQVGRFGLATGNAQAHVLTRVATMPAETVEPVRTPAACTSMDAVEARTAAAVRTRGRISTTRQDSPSRDNSNPASCEKHEEESFKMLLPQQDASWLVHGRVVHGRGPNHARADISCARSFG